MQHEAESREGKVPLWGGQVPGDGHRRGIVLHRGQEAGGNRQPDCPQGLRAVEEPIGAVPVLQEIYPVLPKQIMLLMPAVVGAAILSVTFIDFAMAPAVRALQA